MDPITMALLAGAAATAAGQIGAKMVEGAGNAAHDAVLDAYHGLRDMLAKKFGAQSKVVTAVTEVEAAPDSAGRKAVLREEVGKSKADQDAELLALAHALLEKVKATPGGTQIVQNVTGNENNVIAGTGNQINVNRPKP